MHWNEVDHSFVLHVNNEGCFYLWLTSRISNWGWQVKFISELYLYLLIIAGLRAKQTQKRSKDKQSEMKLTIKLHSGHHFDKVVTKLQLQLQSDKLGYVRLVKKYFRKKFKIHHRFYFWKTYYLKSSFPFFNQFFF